MPAVYSQGGDYAVATLLATQWGLAALTRLGDESDEKTSTLRGDCLAGALHRQRHPLQPSGDQHLLTSRLATSTKAIKALLVFRGEGDVERQGAGWTRVKAFREGVINGAGPA